MNAHSENTPRKDWFRQALIVAAILTFLLVMAGYLVRFDGTQNACPDWPTCYGQLGIPAGLAAQLEMAHRVLAGLSALTIFSVVIWAFRRRETRPMLRLLLLGALVGIIAESVIGGGLNSGLGANIHLGLALLIMALVTAAAVMGNIFSTTGILTIPRTGFSRLAWATLLAVALVMISGAWLTSVGTANACVGWPLCSGGLPSNPDGWLAFGHRILTLVAGILAAALFYNAWRKHYRQPVLLTSATGVGLLFVGQVLISILKVERGYPLDLVALHAAATAALWAGLIVTVTAAAFEPDRALTENQVAARPVGSKRVKAFLMLNKPIIVVLLIGHHFCRYGSWRKTNAHLWVGILDLVGRSPGSWRRFGTESSDRSGD